MLLPGFTVDADVAPVVDTGIAAVKDPLLLIVEPLSTTLPAPPVPARDKEPPDWVVVVPLSVVVPDAVSLRVPATVEAPSEKFPVPCAVNV